MTPSQARYQAAPRPVVNISLRTDPTVEKSPSDEPDAAAESVQAAAPVAIPPVSSSAAAPSALRAVGTTFLAIINLKQLAFFGNQRYS